MKMNKLLAVVAFWGCSVPLQADEVGSRASDQFSDFLEGRSYEGDELPPNNPGALFVRVAVGQSVVEHVEEGSLSFQTENPGDTLSYGVGNLASGKRQSSGWWTDHADRSKGYSVEFRVRALPLPAMFNFIASYDDAEPENNVLSIDAETTKWGKQILSREINDDDFHVYRIVREPKENLYQVWRDGALIGSDLGGSIAAENRFWFGDWGGRQGGGTLDFLRWDTSGAYSPGSEPEQ